MSKVRILVIGDVMSDVYYFGSATRLSPEAPVPVLKVERTEERAGGAANVAANVESLGADVRLISSPNICIKHRGMAGTHQIFRYDDDGHLSAAEARDVADRALKSIPIYDVIVFSDYDKGAMTYLSEMLALCKKLGKVSIVDPKCDDFTAYIGARYITPNHEEWMRADHVPATSVVIETNGAAGAVIHNTAGVTSIPGFSVPCVDPTGAGDSFVAQMAVALGQGKHIYEAVKMANAAGAAAVQHLGTHVVTEQEVYDVYAGRA